MNDLWKKIHDYKYVSFDVFDTLIKRNIEHPKDVFTLIETQYHQKYGYDVAIDNFAIQRIEAEKKARQTKQQEVTLEDIYDILALKFNLKTLEQYKALELTVECDICTPNYELYHIFRKCIEQHKKVLITTDMYLPLEIIEYILKKNGFSGYDKIYLSAKIGKTKAKGDLFDYILQNEKISGNELIHIGDNKKSDIRNAQAKNIKTIHVKKQLRVTTNNLLEVSNIDVNILKTFINNNFVYSRKDLFTQVGFEYFGPLLFGFVDWIKTNCEKNGHQKIYFLSRDGFLMKKAFKVINIGGNLDLHYMYASRRALQVAAIHFCPRYEDVVQSMFLPRKVSIAWLLKRWGLIPENYYNQVKKIGLDVLDVFDHSTVLGNSKIRELYGLLLPEIIENSKREYEALCVYLRTLDFCGNVAIVDIGWYGNMQHSLMTVLKHANLNVNVTGYYLGIVPDSRYQKLYNMHGYLFEANKNEYLFEKFKYLSSLLEIFFMAPHGSAKKYYLTNGIPQVELLEFEYAGSETKDNVDKIQNSALDFVKKYYILANQYVNNNEKLYLNNMYSAFMRPSYKLAKQIGSLQMRDENWFFIASPSITIRTIIKPQRLLQEFSFSSWKMGYLKQLLIVPLPYDDIVILLRKIYSR